PGARGRTGVHREAGQLAARADGEPRLLRDADPPAAPGPSRRRVPAPAHRRAREANEGLGQGARLRESGGDSRRDPESEGAGDLPLLAGQGFGAGPGVGVAIGAPAAFGAGVPVVFGLSGYFFTYSLAASSDGSLETGEATMRGLNAPSTPTPMSELPSAASGLFATASAGRSP